MSFGKWFNGLFERKAATLAAPDLALLELFGALPSASGITVSAESALRVPAVACAVRQIRESIATLPVAVKRVLPDGATEPVPDHPVAALLNGRWNDWTSGYDGRLVLTVDALTRDAGGIAWVNRINGEPREIIRYQPGTISVAYLDTGEPQYLLNSTAGQRQLDLNDVGSAFKKLAPSTAKNWAPWLDRISDHFGDLRIAQFDRPEKIRPHLRQWRNQYADRPRTADYAFQVLSRVLAHAVDQGKLAGNPCEGVKGLYEGANRSEIIWSEADIVALKRTCSPEIAHAIDLAVHTGLRLGDLLRLSWSHVGDDAITIATSKSRHRRKAIIPPRCAVCSPRSRNVRPRS